MKTAGAQAHPCMIVAIPIGRCSFIARRVKRVIQHGGRPFNWVIHRRQNLAPFLSGRYTAFGGTGPILERKTSHQETITSPQSLHNPGRRRDE